MYREAMKDLEAWKSSKNRKPLILEGARQVGKTWLLKEFGRKNYKKVAYVSLDGDERAREIFDGSFDPIRIISRLSIHCETEILPTDTLIILDEIQDAPRALSSLKYFCENAPEYHIAVAGSLLGVSLHQGTSFPVGKVNTIKIHPLTFNEFLIANGKKQLAERLAAEDYELLPPFHEMLDEFQRIYCIVGGMPEVVQKYISDKSLLNVRDVQRRIVEDYERDFSKHSSKFDAPKILEIFNIIPAVLAKENKKFMFGMIKQSARAREYESALFWLVDAGIATRVSRVNKVALPLAAYQDMGSFKLFSVDIGLLGYKAGLRPETIYDEKNFEEFKGALAEQFVFQELQAMDQRSFYYYSDDSSLEIDFIVDGKTGIIPIEVKSGRNLNSPSLNKLLEAHPDLTAVKFSTQPFMKNDNVINMPLYAVQNLKNMLK